MQTPKYWYTEETFKDSFFIALLTPLSWIYRLFAKELAKRKNPYNPPIPVICVGNIVAGGSGKTPTTIQLANFLRKQGKNPHIISKGYGGSYKKALRVDPLKHKPSIVGDEPFLMAKQGLTCWVGKNRRKTAYMASKAGADVILMDDGHQNNDLIKTLSIVVIDGLVGFGNGRMIPAGPLREPILEGLSRAQAVVIIDDDLTGVANIIDKPILQGYYVPTKNELENQNVYAFAGLGRPEKFLRTLYRMGANLTGFVSLPDHYRYRELDIQEIIKQANIAKAIPVTTRKDFVKIPSAYKSEIHVVDVELVWQKEEKLREVLSPILQ